MNRLLTRFADVGVQPTGQLQVGVYDVNQGKPVPNAKITVTPYQSDSTLEELFTDVSGQSASLKLDAPPKDFSLVPEEVRQPYSQYDIQINAPGFMPAIVEGIQILDDTQAIQDVRLIPQEGLARQAEETILIGPHTLWGDYPPKIPEEEIKPMPEDSGFVVLDQPVVPEYIVVHMGLPNVAARDYYIPFKDYIKNVASSEIYSTWPRNTITANVLAIISFTLNRVYTEWYRNKGKNFTITNTTAYDHYFVYGRNIYREISSVVDEIFTTYVAKPGIKQPLLTQYCDGKKTACPNWMTNLQ